MADNGKKLKDIKADLDHALIVCNENKERINAILKEFRQLYPDIGVPSASEKIIFDNNLNDDLINALGVLPPSKLKKLKKEYTNSVPAFPPFDKYDIFLLVLLGGLAGLAEFLLVGKPKGTKWVPKAEGGVIPEGWLSERIKSFQLPENNFLSKICKVPYDKSIISEAGITPSNHRLLSFAHDPSVLGLIFGLMDIWSGGMSGVTRNGQLFHINTQIPADAKKMFFAPLIWLGHLVSDVTTPMGLPPPGWSLTQLLHVPAPGAPGNATIADITRLMYEQGYDFRHYLAGAIVPGLVEIIISVYHFVRYSYPKINKTKDNIITPDTALNQIDELQMHGHKKAMLFWGHATAAAINAGKVAIQGITGDYLSAARSINISQWQMFALRTIEYIHYKYRNKTVEQILANRPKINDNWDKLINNYPIYCLMKDEEAPGV